MDTSKIIIAHAISYNYRVYLNFKLFMSTFIIYLYDADADAMFRVLHTSAVCKLSFDPRVS